MKNLSENLNEEIRKQLFGSTVFNNIEEYQDEVKRVINEQKPIMHKVKNIVCELSSSFIGYENINIVETVHDLKDFKQLRDKNVYMNVKEQLKLLGLGIHVNREIPFGKPVYKLHIYKFDK